MDNEEKIKVLDEYGNEKEVNFLNVLELDNQEYLLYSIPETEKEDGIYAMKIIINNGEKDLTPIDNEEEKKKVFDALNEIIDEIEK